MVRNEVLWQPSSVFNVPSVGSIIHLQVLGTHTIILNSAQATSDLMDKRAAIYSNRPRMPMSVEL